MLLNPPASAGDTADVDLVPGLGRSSSGGNGNPLQYSCRENPMEKGAWRATVHGVTKSGPRLSDWACMHAHSNWQRLWSASPLNWYQKFHGSVLLIASLSLPEPQPAEEWEQSLNSVLSASLTVFQKWHLLASCCCVHFPPWSILNGHLH